MRSTGHRVRVRTALIGLLVVCFGAGSAIAIAAIPDGSGTIHGCYVTVAGGAPPGALRVVENPATCNPDEKAISWSQNGGIPRTGTLPRSLTINGQSFRTGTLPRTLTINGGSFKSGSGPRSGGTVTFTVTVNNTAVPARTFGSKAKVGRVKHVTFRQADLLTGEMSGGCDPAEIPGSTPELVLRDCVISATRSCPKGSVGSPSAEPQVKVGGFILDHDGGATGQELDGSRFGTSSIWGKALVTEAGKKVVEKGYAGYRSWNISIQVVGSFAPGERQGGPPNAAELAQLTSELDAALQAAMEDSSVEFGVMCSDSPAG